MKAKLIFITVAISFFFLLNVISLSTIDSLSATGVTSVGAQNIKNSMTWLSPLAKQDVLQFSMGESLLEKTASQLSELDVQEIPVIILLKKQSANKIAHDVKEAYRPEIETKKKQLAQATKDAINTHRLQSFGWNFKNYLNEREKFEIDSLNQQIDSIKDRSKREIFVRLDAQTASERETIKSVIENCGGRVTGDSVIINAVFARIPKSCLQTLAEQKEISGVYENKKMQAKLDISTPAIGADIWQTNNYNGSAIDVAIVDTGINGTHPALNVSASKVFHDDGWYDFWYFDDNSTADDLHGHGTHIAGIIASKDSTYKGVAPGVNIINAKAGWLDWFGSAGMYESDAMKAIEWAINTSGADVVSYSFGSGTCTGDTPMGRFIDAVVDDLGVFVDVAAGNDGPNECTVASPGSSFNVMSVGDVDDKGTADRGDDIINETSSRGYTFDFRIKPDIAAPGTNIMSANTFWEGSEPDFIEMSGTSMAAPLIGGGVALLLDYNPSLQPIEVKAILINSANNTGDFSNQTSYGWGYADLKRAYEMKDSVITGTLYDIDSDKPKLDRLYKTSVVNGDKTTLVWNRHVTYNLTNYPEKYYNLNDIDLFLGYENNNGLLNYSISSIDNVEQVIANDTYSSAIIKVSSFVSNFSHSSNNESYALASNNALVEVFGPNVTIVNTSIPSQVVINTSFTVLMTINNTGDLIGHGAYANISLASGLVNISGPMSIYLGKLLPGEIKTVNWTVNTTSMGTHDINLSVNSIGYGSAYLSESASSILVTVLTDSTPPQWSNNKTSFTSPTTYNADAVYQFNITLEDYTVIDTVLFNFDGQWKSVSRSGSEFYYNAYSLGAGLHNYSWFANDTSGNVNNTETIIFEILRATSSVDLLLNGNQFDLTITYGTQSNATAVGYNGNVVLYRNGNVVNNPDIATLGVGTYNYTVVISEDANTTGSLKTYILTVNKAATDVKLFLNGNESDMTIPYGTQLNATGIANVSTSTIKLLRNGTEIANGIGSVTEIKTLGAGVYNYTVYVSENENHTSSATTYILTINKIAPTLKLELNGIGGDNSINYKGALNVTGTLITGDATSILKLYRNGTEVTNPDTTELATGNYEYNFTYGESENYTAAFVTHILTVNKIAPTLRLILNGVDGDNSIEVGTSANITGIIVDGDKGANLTLYKNSSVVDNPHITNLSIGVYEYNLTYRSSENYTDSSLARILTVLPSVLQYFIQQQNSTYAPNKNYTLNATWTSVAGVNDVILEFDNVNYSFSGAQLIKSGDVYTKTFTDLAAGNYNYKWYAKDSNSVWNSTPLMVFVIEKAIPSVLEITPAESVTTGMTTKVKCYTNVTGITPQLYRDSEKVLFNIEENNFAAGSYIYFCNNTEIQNYSSSNITKILIVTSPSYTVPTGGGSSGTGDYGSPAITPKEVPVPTAPKLSIRAQVILELNKIQTLLESAIKENKNVTLAQIKIIDAQNAFDAGKYKEAQSLVNEAKLLIEKAPPLLIASQPSVISGLTGAVVAFVSNPAALAASGALIGGGFLYWLFRSGKIRLPRPRLPKFGKREEFKSEEMEFPEEEPEEGRRKKGRKYI